MADVEVICPQCQSAVKISEFADYVVCRKCGQKVEGKTKQKFTKPESPKLRLKELQPLRGITDEVPPSEGEAEVAEAELRAKGAGKGSPISSAHLVGACLVFLVLGGITGWLRYGSVLAPHQLALMKSTAVYVFLGLHVLVLLEAFRDTVFSGILCLLLPPYAIYWLFSVSDSFYLRAVFAGLMAGFGQDAALTINSTVLKGVDSVQQWIARGG